MSALVPLLVAAGLAVAVIAVPVMLGTGEQPGDREDGAAGRADGDEDAWEDAA